MVEIWCSWLPVRELTEFNYDATFEQLIRKEPIADGMNRFVACQAGEGQMRTFRDFLRADFFDDLAMLASSGADRIIFFFAG